MKAFIVEDEVPAMIRMKEIIKSSPQDISICGEASIGEVAIQKINKLRPDVIFLDIQLPDINGFEVLAKITCSPYVIFTTAYSEHALKAFEYHSIDYLIKPIEQEKFNSALKKLEDIKVKSTQDVFQNMDHFMQMVQKPKSTTLAVKERDRIMLLNLDEIAYFEADDKYVNVCCANGKRHLLSKSLSQLELELPPQFHRIQRSFIVNQNYVVELERHFKGRFVLKLIDQKKTTIKTGEMYLSKVKEVFGI
jgi:two-component system LytT family response regulator